MNRFELIHADCRVVMANMGDNTVDSVVCDPPYHLTSIVKRFGPGCAPQQYGTDGAYARAARGFMGQTWDGGDIAFDPTLWAEVLRVLKPGGHLLAFSGTRTYHRMAVAIEDAGFEIRDMFAWLYGSGFPKSHDISKAIDKAAGARGHDAKRFNAAGGVSNTNGGSALRSDHPDYVKPRGVTAEARQWEGWGTAVKPAQEPICLARKPLIGSVAANVLEWGTGGLNIDGCRVGTESTRRVSNAGTNGEGWGMGKAAHLNGSDSGRFPANVLHDGSDAVVAIFPSEAGAAAPVHRRNGDKFRNTYGAFAGNIDEAGSTFQGDSGSAARFFYCAKASKRDRDEGCEHLQVRAAGMVGNDGKPAHRKDEGYEVEKRANHHPTVKPTELMRYLCRLVTPPAGLVFDPFTGSGSTGKAAMLEGLRFIGAEMTAEYIPIARARIEWAQKQAA